MRASPLAAATLLLVVASPTALAAPSHGVALEGPATLAAAEAATLPLAVTLALSGVACAREVEVPVRLTALARGTRAELASERVSFRVPAQSTLMRPWSQTQQTSLLVEPVAAQGLVEVVASYRLPPDCVSMGAPTHGETRHVIHVERVRPERPFPLAPLALETVAPGAADTPPAVQAAIALTGLGGVVVLVKRLRPQRA